MKKNYPFQLKKSAENICHKTGLTFLFFVLLLASKISVSQTYCPSAATSVSDDDIFNVTFGTLNNTSSCSTTGGPGSVLNRYSDYTSTVAAPVMALGGNYPMSVTVGMCGTFGYSGRFGVFIDYNQNGSFTDPGETIFISAYTPFAMTGTQVFVPGGVTIPTGATPGITRMRIVETESSTAPGPCTNPTWGEVEDYNIMILSPSALDLGVSAIINPLSTKRCYAVDTIVARVKNYGTATINFSVNPTVVAVKTSGPNASTYSLAVNTGSLASNATRDFTMTTTYNLTNLGTYIIKGYTNVAGDGSALNDTNKVTIVKNPIFSTSVLPNDTVCLGIPVQLKANFSPSKQVGTGSIQNSSTGYPAPFGNFYEGAKHQFLFRASELSAAGVVAGNLNAISFDAVNLNSAGPLVNYNVAIATTTLTAITAFQTTGFTTYFSSLSYVPVLGANTHNFSTPYIWDGVSNIIIETCFNNVPNYTYNVSVSQSSTPFVSSVWRNADGVPTLCNQTTTSGSMAQRPNISFHQPATITYTWSPATELSATNISNPIANLTTSRTFTVTGITAGCMTYDTVRIHIKPTPTPHLGNDTAFCTLPAMLYANTTASSYLWNNSTMASSLNVTAPGKYWVKASNANGCSLTDTIMVTLGTFPIVTLGPDTAVCQGGSLQLYAGGGSGYGYAWNNGATTSFVTINAPGTYSVLVTNAEGCTGTDIINITSKPQPSVSFVLPGQTVFCVSDNVTKTLSGGSPAGGTYIGAAVTGNTFNVPQSGQGAHIILYTIMGANGCSNTAKDTIIVNACVGIEELSETISLNIYPNPTTGIFTLELNAASVIDGDVTITSIDSRIVFTDKVEGSGTINKSINISHLANGIYYLNVQTKDAVRTYKVLKQ